MTALPALTTADDRAAAVLRFNLCDVLAEILVRRVPGHLTVRKDGEFGAFAKLQPGDAHELARDLVEDLACRGPRREGAGMSTLPTEADALALLLELIEVIGPHRVVRCEC
jgi:hypothetical protein